MIIFKRKAILVRNRNKKMIFLNFRPKKRFGYCKAPDKCYNSMVFWPHDGKCYTLHTRGPCQKGKRIRNKFEVMYEQTFVIFSGKLLAIGKDKLTECLVSKKIRNLNFNKSSVALFIVSK